LGAHGAVALLPEKVDKKDEDEVIVGSDETAEEGHVLN